MAAFYTEHASKGGDYVMKKEYQQAELEILRFVVEDVIVTSDDDEYGDDDLIN